MATGTGRIFGKKHPYIQLCSPCIQKYELFNVKSHGYAGMAYAGHSASWARSSVKQAIPCHDCGAELTTRVYIGGQVL